MTSEVEVQQNQQFSTREVPWMKLGQLISEPVTASEAATLAGLDFDVELLDVAYVSGQIGGNPVFKPIPTRKAVVAKDNGDFMGFASSKMYNTLQYSQAFDFMDTLGAPYVAAGGLRKRRQGFMVVKPELELNVLGGEDPHELYAVLRTSHDCSRGIEVSVMPLRGRCMNQLTLRTFSKDAEYRWSIKHTTTMAKKLADAQDALSKLTSYKARFEAIVQRLADLDVSEGKARNMLKIVIPMPKGKTDRTETQWNDKLDSIIQLWQTAPTVAYAGTGWGLVNAVSEHYEWCRVGGTNESQFLNALEGETHKKINKMTGLLLSAH